MRTLLVSAVSVAALAAPAMAQGSEPLPDYEPSAAYENTAMIEQIGTANSAIVDQTWGNLLNGQALAEVTQNGVANIADVKQASLTIANNGYGNTLKLTQGGKAGSNGGDGNNAVVRQAFEGAASGNRNRVTIRQFTDLADARVRQRGTGNFVRVLQRRNSTEAFVKIDQGGDDHWASVDQRADYGAVRIFQGEFVPINSPAAFPSIGNIADVKSDGTNPWIRIDQFGGLNAAYVTENGIDGRVKIETDGFFNTADVYQYGTAGDVNIEQNLSNLFGGDNMAMVTQEASDFSSEVLIQQEGFGGYSEITQKDDLGAGGDNLATNIQTVDSDMATSSIVQDGASHVAYVHQASAGATSTLAQAGAGLTANVAQ